MVTSKRLPGGSVIVNSKRRGLGGSGAFVLLLILLVGLLTLVGVGIFAPTRLAIAHEQALGMLHGGIAVVDEQTYVDGCVVVDGLEGRRAITRTHRTVSFKDGTTLEVVFSDKPVLTNACQ